MPRESYLSRMDLGLVLPEHKHWYRSVKIITPQIRQGYCPSFPKCQYILFIGDCFYIGQTIDFLKRMKQHEYELNRKMYKAAQGIDEHDEYFPSMNLLFNHVKENPEITEIEAYIMEGFYDSDRCINGEADALKAVSLSFLRNKCLNNLTPYDIYEIKTRTANMTATPFGRVMWEDLDFYIKRVHQKKMMQLDEQYNKLHAKLTAMGISITPDKPKKQYKARKKKPN